MLLNDGICSVFEKVNVAPPGGKPTFGYRLKGQSWYAERSYSTNPSFHGGSREEISVALRIRIHQNRQITNHDAVVLQQVNELPQGVTVYEVVNAYNGTDEENGERVTDLYLEVVEP